MLDVYGLQIRLAVQSIVLKLQCYHIASDTSYWKIIYIYYEINYTILENLIYIYIYEKQTNILNFFENNFLYIYYIRFHFSMYFQRNSLEKYSHYIFRISLCDISEDY